MVIEHVDADPRIGEPTLLEHILDLPRPGRRFSGRIGIGHASLPEHRRPHVRPEGSLPEFGAAILEYDRIAFGRDDDVVHDVDGRPQRHHRDAGAIADVDDVRQDECTEVPHPHFALHLAETVAPQSREIDH